MDVALDTLSGTQGLWFREKKAKHMRINRDKLHSESELHSSPFIKGVN